MQESVFSMEMKKEIPKVSIAMATFNGEQYIKMQLESLRAQTRPAEEVVIFDDCSSDNTVEVVRGFIREFTLSNWILYRNPVNVGFIRNFYRAIAHTTGDIIFLCDQDDVWHRDKIEKMLGLFKENPDIRVLNTGFCKIDPYGEQIKTKRRKGHANNNLIRRALNPGGLHRLHFDDILWRNISPGCTAAFTKELRAFFLENFSGKSPHDWELNLFGSVLHGLFFFNRPFTDYRLHAGNAVGMRTFSLPERFSPVIGSAVIKKAREQHLRARTYGKAPWVQGLNTKQKETLRRFERLTAKRLRTLSHKSVLRWCSLLLFLPDYLKLRGRQGIFDDFKYILQRESETSVRRQRAFGKRL